MKKPYVINYSNLPANPFRLIFNAFMLYTCLMYWDAPMWLIYAFGGLYLMALIASIVKQSIQEKIDLFEDVQKKEEVKQKAKETFRDKLNKMAEERGIKMDSK